MPLSKKTLAGVTYLSYLKETQVVIATDPVRGQGNYDGAGGLYPRLPVYLHGNLRLQRDFDELALRQPRRRPHPAEDRRLK